MLVPLFHLSPLNSDVKAADVSRLLHRFFSLRSPLGKPYLLPTFQTFFFFFPDLWYFVIPMYCISDLRTKIRIWKINTLVCHFWLAAHFSNFVWCSNTFHLVLRHFSFIVVSLTYCCLSDFQLFKAVSYFVGCGMDHWLYPFVCEFSSCCIMFSCTSSLLLHRKLKRNASASTSSTLQTRRSLTRGVRTISPRPASTRKLTQRYDEYETVGKYN